MANITAIFIKNFEYIRFSAKKINIEMRNPKSYLPNNAILNVFFINFATAFRKKQFKNK